MVTIGCNTSSEVMGAEFRSRYLRLCSKALQAYTKLSQACPTEMDVKEGHTLMCDVLDAVQHLKEGTGLQWDAPKLHALMHYADMVMEFGRMRLHDTCISEASVQNSKAAHRKVAGRNLAAPHGYMLKRHEHYDVIQYEEFYVDSRASDRQALFDHSHENLAGKLLGVAPSEPC